MTWKGRQNLPEHWNLSAGRYLSVACLKKLGGASARMGGVAPSSPGKIMGQNND